MPAATPYEVRRQIVEARLAGETLASISEKLNISYNTVKKIWSHWRKYQKLSPNYEQAKKQGTRRYKKIYQAAIDMKKEHPRWGGQLIQIELSGQYPDEDLPSVRTLQRWFKQAGVSRSPKLRQCRVARVERGQESHEVWAVDAKEQMKLADGTYACWLTVTDEASGCILASIVFPPTLLVKGTSQRGSKIFTKPF